jgi:hypothetical protein
MTNKWGMNMRACTHRNLTKRLTLFAASLLIGGAPWATTGMAQGPAIAAPVSNWEFIDHSSTFGEGIQRGYANVLRGAGELVYMDSLAAVNYQEAYKRALENRVAYTKAALDIKAMRTEYRERYGSKPFVGEARRKAIESYLPKKLSASEFNSRTNQLTWPHILRQEEYAPLRVSIDKLFATRTADNSGDGSPSHLETVKLTKMLAALLRENVNSMSIEQYIYASEYIRSVELEARSVALPKDDAEEQLGGDALPAVPVEANPVGVEANPKGDSQVPVKTKVEARPRTKV